VLPEQAMVIPFERSFDGTLGFETLEISDEHARGVAPVEDRIKQPWGLVHGGALCGFAEGLCSQATGQGVWEDGMTAMGLSNHTSFMRPITAGHVHVEARRRHRGRTTWIWEVDITDDDGRLCALSRVTVAVRPRPS
jgi:1,4-dihydroxy-2-naphthoyl-CoA hydrolase